jgi:hypothetical protein
MCRFSPLRKTKGHPEGNCKSIIADKNLFVKNLAKVANSGCEANFPRKVVIDE